MSTGRESVVSDTKYLYLSSVVTNTSMEAKALKNLEKIQHLQKRRQAQGWTLHFLYLHGQSVEK